MNEHYGTALRAARKAAGFKTQEALGDVINRSARMVRIYEKGQDPPSEPEVRIALERELGAFWAQGDAVESAIRRSELADFRQSRVLSVYQEALREERREQAG